MGLALLFNKVLPVPGWKDRVAWQISVNLGQQQFVGQGQGGRVELATTDHEDARCRLLTDRGLSHRDGALKRAGDLRAAGPPIRLARDDDVAAAWQWSKALGQRIPGFAAHDHRATQGLAFEPAHVLGLAPDQLAAQSYAAVARHRSDQRQRRPAHALIPPPVP